MRLTYQGKEPQPILQRGLEMSTAKARKAKQTTIPEMTGTQFLGEIVTFNARSKNILTKDVIERALLSEGLDNSLAKDLLPRHAFARACREMSDNRIISVLKEENNHITFQFTKQFLDSSQEEWKYAKEALLILNKTTGEIECKANPQLETVAKEKLAKSLVERTTNDITRIVQKLYETNSDLFSLRDQGGVYFVPEQHKLFNDKVQGFLTHIGGSMLRFPIPKNTLHGDHAVKDAVGSGLQEMIQELNTCIQGFTLNTRGDTLENTMKRIKGTQSKIEAYAEYLGSKQKLL
jgi:hypothetical protein